MQQQEQIPIVTTLLPSTSARTLIDNFIRNRLLARTTPPAPPHGNRVEWEEFRPNQWEHTKWLNRRRVDEDLRSVFYDDDSSRFVDSLETSTHDRNKALLRRQAPFVALVNGKEELKGLVDRHVFLNQLAIYLAREAENQMP